MLLHAELVKMGINYIGSSNQLDGCISYLQNVKRFICGKSSIILALASLTHLARSLWL